jgi:hypothetical protein
LSNTGNWGRPFLRYKSVTKNCYDYFNSNFFLTSMRNPPANAKPMESAKPTKKFIDGGAVPVNSPPTKPPMIRANTENDHAKININQMVTVTNPLNICGISSSQFYFMPE